MSDPKPAKPVVSVGDVPTVASPAPTVELPAASAPPMAPPGYEILGELGRGGSNLRPARHVIDNELHAA